MELKFSKYADGLIPAIIQDAETRVVLMLGFMNQEAYDKTIETGKVTFYSRSRQTLWTKGETSGNFLMFVNAKVDCDNDTLLIKAHPIGPTKGGFACEITRQVSEMVDIPVIASGGAGTMEHFKDVFIEGKADAALAASIFHFKEISIPELKAYLKQQNIPIR